jgi:hypothetical protein
MFFRNVVLTRRTRHHLPEDGIFHSHRHEIMKSYIAIDCVRLHGTLQNKFPKACWLALHTRFYLRTWTVCLLVRGESEMRSAIRVSHRESIWHGRNLPALPAITHEAYGLNAFCPDQELGIQLSRQQRNYVKNAVSWDVTPCDSCNNRRIGGT